MADRHAIYKNGVKEIAFLQGKAVTFMAKWDFGLAGSSCHIHSSLVGVADGKPVFADKSGAYSNTFKHYIAGQLALARELTLFLAPYINSYKRFQAGSFAPTKAIWSTDNRTAGFRVIGGGPSLRVECRIPGADANPYLAYAALLAAGLHGIEQKLELEPVVHGRCLSRQGHPGDPEDAARGARVSGQVRGPARGVRRCRGRALSARRPLGAVRIRSPDHRSRADPRLRAGLRTMSERPEFAGRTAVVTGAGGGMGLQIARDLMAAGARVAGIDVKPRPAELDAALYAEGDVSDDGFVAAAVARAFAATGRLDLLVNAAGILLFDHDKSLVEIDACYLEPGAGDQPHRLHADRPPRDSLHAKERRRRHGARLLDPVPARR